VTDGPSASHGVSHGVRARDVSRVFDGQVRALERVSLDVAPGALVTIVGPSGCGKTTLLRILGGLDQATSGTVAYFGAHERGDARERGDAHERLSLDQASIGFAFQEARLLPWRPVVDNIALPLELRGQSRASRRRQAEDMAAAVGLGDALTRLPGQLSGGMRMRAAIARALITRPALLLLDEPFGALDEITRQSLDDLLLDLWRARGMTVVMVTHSITEAVYLGQTVVVLAPGPGRVVHTMQPSFAARVPGLRATGEFAAAAAQVLHQLGAGMEAGAARAP
jgi:NitT/TauT family transport system ATP-binding protein